jgi:hypothetical protein
MLVGELMVVVLPFIMATPLSVGNKEEQRTVIWFLWLEDVAGQTFSTIRKQRFATTECPRID